MRFFNQPKRMLEKDFKKYAQIHNKNSNMRVSHEDLVAIQQIEFDRGNYNIGSDQPRFAPRPTTKTNRTPPRSSHDHQKKTPRSAEKARKKTHPPPSGQRNLSKEFRPKKSHPLDPTIRPQDYHNSVAHFPGPVMEGDGVESVESFGEFHSPKELMPMRRFVMQIS